MSRRRRRGGGVTGRGRRRSGRRPGRPREASRGYVVKEEGAATDDGWGSEWVSGWRARPLTHRSAWGARRGGQGCVVEERRRCVGQPRGHIAVDVVVGEDAVAADVVARAGTPYAMLVHGAQAVGWSNWRPRRRRPVLAPSLAASTRQRSPRLPASTEKTWRRRRPRGGAAVPRLPRWQRR